MTPDYQPTAYSIILKKKKNVMDLQKPMSLRIMLTYTKNNSKIEHEVRSWRVTSMHFLKTVSKSLPSFLCNKYCNHFILKKVNQTKCISLKGLMWGKSSIRGAKQSLLAKLWHNADIYIFKVRKYLHYKNSQNVIPSFTCNNNDVMWDTCTGHVC